MRRYLLIGVAVAMLAITLAAAACGDDNSNNVSSQWQTAGADAQKAGMMSALYIADNAGLHGIDTTLATPGAKVDASWLGKVRNAQAAVATVTWPEDVREKAAAFADAAGRLGDALERDDAKGAAAPAHDAHEAGHELSHDGWAYLAKQAGVKPVGGGE